MKRIYLDNASLTPIRKEVMKEMIKYSSCEYGNPSSIYTEGVNSKKATIDARKRVASVIGAHSDEIIFTGSGTEANNLAIFGVIDGLVRSGKKCSELHAVTSMIEHASVLETFQELEKRGVDVTYVPVDKDGILDMEIFKKSLRKETVLVSIMYVNNEIGVIEPILEIAKTIRHKKQEFNSNIILHTDASQAGLYLDLNVEKLGIDLLTLDGHKIYGPRGVGMLYVKRGVSLLPIIYGGGQENGFRSATENVPAILGFAMAIDLAKHEREKEVGRLILLKNYCIHKLISECGAEINGDKEYRIVNNVHVSIPNVDCEFLVLQLDVKGIAVSTKSSCLRDSDESYVLRAIGKKDPKNGIRITFGRDTRKKDIDYLIKVLRSFI
ncbi:MAG: cysteine desulfurase [Candidatus Taylorbacteria bacterium]|nr:cysteine desulfurase [Candidatus Taylorbacteria bacterium]